MPTLELDHTDLERDRRRSPRWATDKPLSWRVHQGRKVRTGRVIERSLQGMVIESALAAGERVGTILRPCDPGAADRHGFRTAVVRRVEELLGQGRRLYVEILA